VLGRFDAAIVKEYELPLPRPLGLNRQLDLSGSQGERVERWIRTTWTGELEELARGLTRSS
jgi:hypothetical protein